MSRLPEVTSYPASMPVHDVALWPSLGRWGVATLIALAAWAVGALWSPAQANGVNWSFGVNVPGGAIVVGEHRPVAVYPAPVYRSHSYPVYPAPVYPAVTYPAYPVAVYPPPARVYDYAPRVHAPRHPYRHHDRYGDNGRYPDHHRNPYAHGGSRHWDDGRGRWDHR